MAVHGLHMLVLQVSDLDTSLAYYEAALGVRFARQSERAVQACTSTSPSATPPRTTRSSPRGASHRARSR